MILDRGTEIRNGFILPKSGSWSYEYELVDAKISIRWLLSSNSAFTEYYFDITGDKLQIEKFYDNNSVLGTILTFERID
ncbi:MAG: hypothetical protein NWS46_11310 [Cyclobacteriaceae bacterium]|jgi:hypothetical protein|nr:hypothetical protein [Cyclobacteriaceae bacterium]